MCQDKNIDNIVLFLGIQKQMAENLAEDIIKIRESCNKPLVITWMAPPANTVWQLRQAKIPVFTDAVRSIKSLGQLVSYYNYYNFPRISCRPPINNREKAIEYLKRVGSSGILSEFYAGKLLEYYQIARPKGYLATSLEELRKIVKAIGFPVALKVDSPAIVHKSDIQGVKLNVSGLDAAEKAFHQLWQNVNIHRPEARINGILVQEMVAEVCAEMILGMKKDSTFGPTMVLGAGGVLTELLQDTAVRIPPLNEVEALEMLKKLKVYKLLMGFRSSQPGDIEALIKTIVNFSYLAYEMEKYIDEIEINPLLVLKEGKGVKAVDALVILH